MKKYEVVIDWINEDGSGAVEVYEVGAEELDRCLEENEPETDLEWEATAKFVKERGRLLYRVEPDYSITLYTLTSRGRIIKERLD